MKNIAVFYHCVFAHGDPPQFSEGAMRIIAEQMNDLDSSGLLDVCSEMIVGINGGEESEAFADLVIPEKAKRIMHGLDSRSENLTIAALEQWLSNHPNWYVLYFHSKGATHADGEAYLASRHQWRVTMMHYLVDNWRDCVAALDSGNDSAGCHFMRGACDGSQNLWTGNFWWATSNFLRTLPSIYERARIKMSGIGHIDSRFEAEVWIGNGRRIPRVMQYLPRGGYGVM